MTEQDVRLGVDIGGTFTDVVLEAGGNSYSTKVLTTYVPLKMRLLMVCIRCARKQASPHPPSVKLSMARL